VLHKSYRKLTINIFLQSKSSFQKTLSLMFCFVLFRLMFDVGVNSAFCVGGTVNGRTVMVMWSVVGGTHKRH
jgi:hypothetical protein